MSSNKRPTIRVNLPVLPPARRNYGTLKTNETTPYINTSLYSSKTNRTSPPKPGVLLRRQTSNPFASQLNNVYHNNSNSNGSVYSNATSVSLNKFNLKPTIELPKNLEGYKTPNRPIYSPFGKYGLLPDEPPRRKHTRKASRNRKRQSRKYRRH